MTTAQQIFGAMFTLIMFLLGIGMNNLFSRIKTIEKINVSRRELSDKMEIIEGKLGSLETIMTIERQADIDAHERIIKQMATDSEITHKMIAALDKRLTTIGSKYGPREHTHDQSCTI